MEIDKKYIYIITVISFIVVFVFDFIDITQYIEYLDHIDGTIANVITFISILIGFISTIYVMIQQVNNSYVLKLLRRENLLISFNKSFKGLMYVGFFDVLALVLMNFFASNIVIFKYLVYFVFPITVYFLLASINIITTICKIINAEEALANETKKVEKSDILI